jgi:short-subunit dehydrogenase
MGGSLARLAQRWRRRAWHSDPAALAAYTGLRPMAVITGGSEGIGLALARRFAAGGHDVLLIARRPQPLLAAAAAIRARFNVAAVAVPLDITSPTAVAAIDAALARQQAYADVLVNNAGIGLSGPFHEQPPEAVLRLLDLNVRALTVLTRHFLPGMCTRGRGGILNIASLGGFVPGPYQAVYYASKAYVLSFTEALAAETAGQGVRVCAFAPGPVATQFHARMQALSAYYCRLFPLPGAGAVAWAAYYGYLLGLRVTLPGPFSAAMALALRLLPHRILVPIVAWLLKPRGTE